MHEQLSTLLRCVAWVLSGVVLGVLAGGWMSLHGEVPHRNWILTAGGITGGIIGNLTGMQFLIARLCPYLRPVLSERRNEIERLDHP